MDMLAPKEAFAEPLNVKPPSIALAVLSLFSVCYADVIMPGIDPSGHGLRYRPELTNMLPTIILTLLILLAIGFCVYKIINKIIKSKKNNDKK